MTRYYIRSIVLEDFGGKPPRSDISWLSSDWSRQEWTHHGVWTSNATNRCFQTCGFGNSSFQRVAAAGGVQGFKPLKNSRSQLGIWEWYWKCQLIIWTKQSENIRSIWTQHNSRWVLQYCQEAQTFENGGVEQAPASSKRVIMAHIFATCNINALSWEHCNDPTIWNVDSSKGFVNYIQS